ncbi:hypothetical protein EV1_034194 [Malus domestica]
MCFCVFSCSFTDEIPEGEYSDLSVEERLRGLVALIGVANERNTIRVVLEDSLEAANALKKQMLAEAQLDKSRRSGGQPNRLGEETTGAGRHRRVVGATAAYDQLSQHLVDANQIDLIKDIVKEFEVVYDKIIDTELAIVSSMVKLESQHLAQIAKQVQKLTGYLLVRKNFLYFPIFWASWDKKESSQKDNRHQRHRSDHHISKLRSLHFGILQIRVDILAMATESLIGRFASRS